MPQDSVLGPLLLLIYINDIKYIASNNDNIFLYGDDINIFIVADSLAELQDKASKLCNNLSKRLFSRRATDDII